MYIYDFNPLVESLLLESELVIKDITGGNASFGSNTYKIREIEIYYYDEDHEDPFVHCDPDQKSFGKWYFHKRGGTYKGGTFKGLDFTIGSDNVYGGALIRSIENDELIEGPCNCVDEILRVSG